MPETGVVVWWRTERQLAWRRNTNLLPAKVQGFFNSGFAIIFLGTLEQPGATPMRDITCSVDAAYWEVYARDAALLERLKERFPEAVPRDWAHKAY